ncbi:MAG: hypothetical protein A2033_10660 [Bacteroidetes bacterium GWA2_31_9]|nr:MAG: hypothetical protein A2033_10660 [Bacteroidetes bacterium GWA2_31_9]
MSFIILPLLLFIMSFFTDSPHGKDFKISCSDCHSTKGWAIDKEILSFDHKTTLFPLSGQHKTVDCKTCHTSLVFSEAKTDCFSCHADLHNQTLGSDCNNCHTPDSWLVSNVTEIHQQSRFPLLGVHTMAECQQCHKSESLYRFDVLGVECFDCHKDNYLSTTLPNHASANFSKECTECHYIYAYEWGGAGFNHSFFPLTGGHDNVDCSRCHINGNYSNISQECYSCHADDYNSATNPIHKGSCFPTNCTTCHTTNPGWSPVNFGNHDTQYFPITKGKHSGIQCNECHTNAGSCNIFSCIDCHEHNKSDMDKEHDDEGGYSYNSLSCYGCHPAGRAED